MVGLDLCVRDPGRKFSFDSPTFNRSPGGGSGTRDSVHVAGMSVSDTNRTSKCRGQEVPEAQ